MASSIDSLYADRPRGHRLGLGVIALLCLLYVPYAASYGLWDPWETHYGEVARQMVERNDWISLWWPGSPQDPATFWSKPVLTFWLMALSLKLFGLGKPGLAHAAEMTTGWTAEWALRLPFVLLGVAGAWAVYELVRRTAGRAAALWSAILLGTAAQWALISRQAMTDMAFVTPMTVAVVFAALALLLPESVVRRELPRRTFELGRPGGRRLRLSFPADRGFYGLLALYVLCVAPQLVVYLAQLDTFTFTFAGRIFRAAGVLGVLPFVLAFLASLLWLARARDRRAIYLNVAYVMAGLATLAKGPAGLAMPLLTLLLYLALSGRLRELLRLELLRGGLIFLCVAAPWYAVMVLRHGAPFWMELIGDNYVRRAQGRHGDRGTFEYYLRQLAAGLFPWPGVVVAALCCCRRWLRGRPERRQLVLLCLCWFVVDFTVVSLVNTKFHHYILPALPPLCVLGGLLLAELCEGEGLPRDGAVALVLLGLPLLWLAGRDLAGFPARIGWLFNYDYVNAPGTGRLWPASSIYGRRYEYGGAVLAFSVAAVAMLALLAQRALGAGRAPGSADAGEGGDRGTSSLWPRALLLALLLALGVAVSPPPELVAQFSSSKLPAEATLPMRLRLGFLVPAAAAGLWLLGLARAGGLLRGVAARGRRGVLLAALGLSLVAVTWNAWILDRFLVDLSPHWSQKHVFATYYRMRTGPREPVVAWYMYWRGENLYTRNQIFDPRLGNEDKTVFLGDNHTEKLKAYVEAHRGRRIFFVFERHRLELLRSLLPPEARASLQVVDESNNKIYLAVASL